MKKAIWNDTVIAEANDENMLRIEGNWYFPPESMIQEYFSPSDYRTTCFWKGEAHYYDVTVDGQKNTYGAWYYPQPMDGSIERVKGDFTKYVAFWNGIKVTS